MTRSFTRLTTDEKRALRGLRNITKVAYILCFRNEAQGTLKTVKHLFAKFTVWYGNAWERVLETEWLEVVRQMQITDIGLALNFLRSPDNSEYGRYPPSPLEFLHLPKKIKTTMVPTMEECFNAAMRSDWHCHPIVYPV